MVDDGNMFRAEALPLPDLDAAVKACRLLGLDYYEDSGDLAGRARLAGCISAAAGMWEVTAMGESRTALAFQRGWRAAYPDAQAVLAAAGHLALGAGSRANAATRNALTGDTMPMAVAEQLETANAAIAVAVCAVNLAAELSRPAADVDGVRVRRLDANLFAAVNAATAAARKAHSESVGAGREWHMTGGDGREPTRPQGVRLHLDSGVRLLDHTLRYAGRDADGCHMWEAYGPAGIVIDGPPTITIDVLPARTGIAVPLAATATPGLMSFAPSPAG